MAKSDMAGMSLTYSEMRYQVFMQLHAAKFHMAKYLLKGVEDACKYMLKGGLAHANAVMETRCLPGHLWQLTPGKP